MTAPLDPTPTKIVCVGKNYADHAKELGGAPPSEPLLFLKPPSSLIGNGDAILIPPGAGRVDFEGEVAFQVGRTTSHVREEEALEHLSGVMPLNDVTARDMQNLDDQWFRAKGFDTFCAVGAPVRLDAIDIPGLGVETRLNGELRQNGRFSDVVFDLPFLVSYISRIMTLEPGDIIATGTPSGIGPIVPWDEVEVTIPGVGSVKNPVRAASGEPWPLDSGG